jgi:hypothetical protein
LRSSNVDEFLQENREYLQSSQKQEDSSSTDSEEEEDASSSSDDSSSLSSDVNGSSVAFSNKMAQLRHRPMPDEEAISSDSSLNESFEKKYLVNGGLTTS